MGCFKVDFEITDYKDILPPIKEYLKNDYIINADHLKRGDIDNCIWKKADHTSDYIASSEFRKLELKRILKTGVFIIIKNEIVWLPPMYYHALQYGKVGEVDLQFRLKRLKHVYEKIRARNNPECKGTLTIKNRADGETTMAVSDAMWEMMDGITNVCNIGLQSKTRSDAINPCWSTVQVMWQSYPQWIKDELYSDFASGDNIAEKIKFMRAADPTTGKSARNIIMQYYPCTFNAMDGKHNMKRCILDEICKWIEAEFYDTFTNYSKFIMPGFERRGLFDMFSSPADVPTKSNEQVYTLWKDSDTTQMQENGTTRSRIHRIYSNPLEGIQGAYDKFGDADPDKIYNWIMSERKRQPKEKLQGEIRGYPLNENEMFDSMDGSSLWDNKQGIESRKIYLIGTRFKDEKTKEPIKIYGNLEWRDGIVDTDVDFRQADRSEFDVDVARFCFSYLPQNKEALKYGNVIVRGVSVGDRPKPPPLIQSCIGIDPFAKRYPGKVNSNGAMVNHQFADLFQTGISKCPTMIYCCRPSHQEIMFEDAIKAAIFCRSLVQPESINDKIIDFFEDRGYMDWMLAKIGHNGKSVMKGDAPTGGKNALLDEIILLINAATNIPLTKGDSYLLDKNWFYELLDDVSRFNRADTHLNDLSMAWGQALLGSAKLLKTRIRVNTEFTDDILNYLFT